MTVCGRVHDIWLDAFGTNPVLYSMLQEYIAFGIGRDIGKLTFFSNGLYGTAETFNPISHLEHDVSKDWQNPYVLGNVSPFPIMSTDLDTWRADLCMFVKEGPVVGFKDRFFKKVASPIFTAYDLYKDSRAEEAVELLDRCSASDWALACRQWIGRRVGG